MKSKIWLCGMTNEGNLTHLKELIEPIYDYFNGLVWVFHTPKDDGARYLESRKKDGSIEYIKWYHRFDFARNHYLFCGTIKEGDWFLNIDTQERLNPEFCEKLPELISLFESKKIDGCLLAGKRFLYKFNEATRFEGSPHEGIRGANRVVELTQVEGYENKDDYQKNIRGEARSESEQLKKDATYYLSPNTNHCLLGMEDKIEEFYKRQEIRLEFRNYLRKIGFDLSDPRVAVENLLSFWKDSEIDREMEFFIHNEDILNALWKKVLKNNKNGSISN